MLPGSSCRAGAPTTASSTSNPGSWASVERVAGNPDSLAGIPQIHRLAGRRSPDWSDDEWPEWELLNYVPRNAYERATGEKDGLDNALGAQGRHRICDAAPQDDRWNYDDPGQRLARLPRLTALLG